MSLHYSQCSFLTYRKPSNQTLLISLSFFYIIDDHSLVELSMITSDEDSSYINANFIKVHPIFHISLGT